MSRSSETRGTLRPRMTRNELHKLVDRFGNDQIDAIAELLEAYRTNDRALVSLLTAPSSPPELDELAALGEKRGKFYAPPS